MFEFNLDSGKHNGVALHEITVKVPDSEEELQDFLGTEIKVVLGIGKKEVYVAAGNKPLDTLKAAMASKAEAPGYPVIYNLRVLPMLEYAATTTGQPLLDSFVEMLTEKGHDKMTVYSKAIENGIFTRMEMEDGPLALIQLAVEEMGGIGGGADF